MVAALLEPARKVLYLQLSRHPQYTWLGPELGDQ